MILDVTMPRMTGLQAARELASRKPGLRILMLSMHENEQFLFEALRAGASGYVLKTAADRDLVNACRATMRGETFLYAGAVAALVREHLDRDATSLDPLTPREIEVVKLVAEGHTSDEIAGMLFISRKTVDRHRANILEKLGMRDRVDLTRYAIRRGLITPVDRDAHPLPASRASDQAGVVQQTALSVLVVDDHPALRAGLERLLDQEAGYRLLGAVSSEAELAVALQRHRPDVVVMDYALARGDGLSACFRLKQRPHPPGVVLYSAYVDDVFAVPATLAQADAIVSKNASRRGAADGHRRRRRRRGAGAAARPGAHRGGLGQSGRRGSPDRRHAVRQGPRR